MYGTGSDQEQTVNMKKSALFLTKRSFEKLQRMFPAAFFYCLHKNSGLLSGDPATVDDEDITVDVGRFIAGQEQCGVGDALRRAWFWCGRQ